jgi:N-acetylmuramoyl-L-alanine amidase
VSATRAFMMAAAVLALGLACAASVSAETFIADVPGSGLSESVEVFEDDGVYYFRLSDLATVVGGARHWNPQTTKMTLAVGVHRISMTAGSQFVSLDDGIVNVVRPISLRGGSFWVPSSFLHRALAKAINSDIIVDASTSSVTFEKLGALVGPIAIEERPTGTAAVVSLNERVEFTARSRDRGRVDVFVPGAALVDTLDVIDGSGLVASVRVEETGAGVLLVVRVAPSATSYSADVRSSPYRLELLVEAERQESIPPPMLRGSKHLAPVPDREERNRDDVKTVVIDPGHGGADRGKVGPSGVAESDVALAIARELALHLQGDGFYVFMTRSSDSDVPLKRRAEIANLASADIFVSIHCGSWHSGAGGGFRVSYYMPPGGGGRGNRSAGGLERDTHEEVPESLREFLWDDTQRGLVDESRELARAVHARLESALDQRDRGVGGGDIPALAGCSMPAILVEPAYMSNASEAALLSDPGYRSRVAAAIARGIADRRSAVRGAAN